MQTDVEALIPKDINLQKMLMAFILLVVCIVVVKLLIKGIARAVQKLPIDKTVSHLIVNVLRVLLYLVTILIVADELGIPVSTLVTLLGVIGLAISLAVQDSLSNLFSGLTLLLSKPFKLGDYIEVGGTGGTVDNIGLMYTRLLTADNKTVHIPNKQASLERVVDFTSQKTRRVDITVSAAYQHDEKDVQKALLDAAKHDCILNSPAPFAGMLEFQESGILYTLRVWVEPKNYWDVYFFLMNNVKQTFDQRGISIPFNQLEVRVLK